MKPKLQDIINENQLYNRKHLHTCIGYDRKTKVWKFMGWICGKCDQTLRTEYVAKKHICQSNKLRRKLNNDIMDLNVKTVDGKVWKSIVLDN